MCLLIYVCSPPCRQFTPLLAKFYQDLQAQDPESLEIVFVSSDQDYSSFNNYFNTQPWSAVQFNDNARTVS